MIKMIKPILRTKGSTAVVAALSLARSTPAGRKLNPWTVTAQSVRLLCP